MTRKRKLLRGRRNWILFACAVLALLVLAGCGSKDQNALFDFTSSSNKGRDILSDYTSDNNKKQDDSFFDDTSDSDKKQDALLDYINRDLVKIAEIEEEMLDSYNGITGVNYTDDLTMYNELVEVTLPLCQELSEAVQDVSPDDTEIARVHNIYRKYVTKYLNAFAMMISALETQDVSKVVDSNDLLTEGADLALDFQEALQKLADERDVVFE